MCVNLVDVSLQDVMSKLQNLRSVQLSFLPAEPEGHENMTTPGEKKENLHENPTFVLRHFLYYSQSTYLGSQRNLSSWPSSLHINHSLKDACFRILLPSLHRRRKGDSCSRRCKNSAQCSVPPVRAPAFTISNSWRRAYTGRGILNFVFVFTVVFFFVRLLFMPICRIYTYILHCLFCFIYYVF